MNYYLDFDNTLYETAKLTSLMLEAIANTISESTGEEACTLKKEANETFNSTIDNIFSFAENMSKKHGADSQRVLDKVNEVIDNGNIIVFKDAIRFLKRLKENGHKAFILTYVAKGNEEYQMRKLLGSGLMKYFDGITITTEYKFLLDLKYEKGVFIDDDPRDLNGLFEKNPIQVIRIRKPNNKRSKIDIDNNQIKEYESFDNIVVQ